MKWCAPGSRRRVLRGVVSAVLAASTLVGVSGSPAGAWSSGDGAVAVFGSTGDDEALSVAVDSSGNVYTTGYFSGTADFDPGSGTTNLTSNGGIDVFVSKLDSSGNLANPSGVTVSKTTATVTEAGASDSFTVVLDTQPASDVVLAVTSSDTGEAVVSPSPLTFTSSNWDTAQTVTVTGVDDIDVDGNQVVPVIVSVDDDSSAASYRLVADSTVNVTNTDNDSVTQTDCTLQSNWNLSECACPPGQTRTSSSSGTCATTTPDPVAAGPEVVLSAFAVEDDGFVTWVPSRTAGLQSYVLTWRPPLGSWTTHSSYTDPNSLKDTLVGLADGDHSFRVFATYTDGAYVESNIEQITVPTPPPGPTVDPEPIEVDPFDCAAFPSLILSLIHI